MSYMLVRAGMLLFGFLMTFVLSASARNRREGRNNPAIMVAVGYVLTGISVTIAAGLPVLAWLNPASVSEIVRLS